MAIDIKFDLVGNPEPPTIILTNRSGKRLGQLQVDERSIDISDKFNDASEFSFTLNKYIDGELTNLWDKVVDFKLVYCKEWDKFFEIKVELDEATETIKTVFCTQLGQAELSQTNLYNIEINTEDDIARENYDANFPTILYRDPTEQNGYGDIWNSNSKYTVFVTNSEGLLVPDEDATYSLRYDILKKSSLLHRIFEKAPHYSIDYVDDTIKKIQKTFSFDSKSIHDVCQEISEEIGCLFDFPSNSDENGKPHRTVCVYDLYQTCENCGYRSEFIDECPECGSKSIKNGYGEDTVIFVTSDMLASSGIQLTTDVDSVKNSFKLEAGDDLMTATVRNCNPNGTDYIWHFSNDTKEDMSDELVEGLERYNETYNQYYNDYVSEVDEGLVDKYNALVDKYKEYYNTSSTCLNCDNRGKFYEECPVCGSDNLLLGDELKGITLPIKGYSALMNAYYNTIDLSLYLQSGLMPSVEISGTTAKEQAALLTAANLSPVAVSDITIASLPTIDSVVLSMAKVVVKSTYKVQINASELVEGINSRSWKGNFVVTNYANEEDTVISDIITISVNDELETFIKQKIDKTLDKEDADDLSIVGLFEKEYDDFCIELKKYALNSLLSFRDACQSCIDVLIEQGVGNDSSWSNNQEGSDANLYEKLYLPYREKLKAIESEIKIREEEISIILGVYSTEGKLSENGLQTEIERCRNEIQRALDFETFLGNDLWLEFYAYRREDKYTNENYISDGLNNAELFEKALEFFELAQKEINKAAELQYSISTSLNNLLAIPEFKPLVKYFKVGNWIRVRIDDKVYKLRLLEYGINYNDFNNIPVEFSEATKVKNSITDTESVLSQASSMATSYNSVQKQASHGETAQNIVKDWTVNGLNSALVQIQNNENEEIIFDKNGLLCRSYDDITGTYSPEQLKITHNIFAYTNDDWQTVKSAIGKHNYISYDETLGSFVGKTGYGISAEFITAGNISGSQIIGGDIYSDNYSITDKSGSYLNLTDGTFSFAGGKLTYDGDHLAIDGEITVATTGTIGCWEVNEFSIWKGSSDFDNQSGMYFGTEGLSLGNKFVVSKDGDVVIRNGTNQDVMYIDEGDVAISGYLTQINSHTKALVGNNVYGNPGFFIYKEEDYYLKSDGTYKPYMEFWESNLNYSMITGVNKIGINVDTMDGAQFTSIECNPTGGVLRGAWDFNQDQYFSRDIYAPAFFIKDSSNNKRLSIWCGSEPGFNSDQNENINFSVGMSVKLTCNSSGGQLYGTWYGSSSEAIPSDENVKNNIEELPQIYSDFFDLLKPIRYKYNDGTSDRYHTGLIAQDVERALNQVKLPTEDFAGFIKTDEDEYYLRYEEFIALCINEIQKIKEENIELRNKIDSLESGLLN